MNLLEVNSVSKDFVGKRALDSVSLEVGKGKIHGLLGPNGAGKTTLLRIINHIAVPDEGNVTLNSRPLTPADVASIGYLPEERGLYKKMKVRDQALFFGRLKGLTKKEAQQRLDYWLNRFEITDWADKKIEELSKGMAQKVQFIITVLHNPSLLIFDEPFSGFDPINAELLKNEILNLHSSGATIILSTHNMASVEELCDDITLLNHGRVVLRGNVNEIRTSAGHGYFQLTYEGSDDSLSKAIAPVASIVATSSGKTPAQRSCRILLREGVEKRQLISLINNTVTIDSFSSWLPTMDEIFINAVKSNQYEQ